MLMESNIYLVSLHPRKHVLPHVLTTLIIPLIAIRLVEAFQIIIILVQNLSGAARLPKLLFNALCEEYFQQRLVRNISLICEYLQVFEHGFGKPDRDGAGRWLQVGKSGALRLFPLHVHR